MYNHALKKVIYLAGIFTITLLSFSIAYAGNPSTPILPSDNIQDPGDPLTSWGGCGPTDSNCYVNVTGTQWTTTGSDIYYNTGNVGIGNNNPTSKLDVKVSGSQNNIFKISDGTDSYFVINGIGDNTNAIGVNAGNSASGTLRANFFGLNAGDSATGASNSNFFGFNAGSGAVDSSNSIFIGTSAGQSATNIKDSNFIGRESGYGVTGASNSNFIGNNSGYGATNAQRSNFFGLSSGNGATNASYSNLIGYAVGASFTSNNIGSNNIIIGTNISLPDATANGLNIGGLIFGSGAYSTIGGNPSILPTSSGKIGIGDSTPDYRLDIADTGIDGYIFSLTDSDGECLHDPEAGSEIVSCSSDERLKNNIVDATSALNYFSDFRIRDYNVIASNTKMTGVIAQEILINHPELVTTGANGMYSVQLPNQWKVIKAIQELDLKIQGIENFNIKENTFADNLRIWFSNATNKISRIFTGEICLTDIDGTSECINKSQLGQLKQLLNNPQTIYINNNGGSGQDNNPPSTTVEGAPTENPEAIVAPENNSSANDTTDVTPSPNTQ